MTVDERTTWSAQLVATSAHREFYDPDLDRSALRRGDGAGYSLVGKRTARRDTVTLAGDGRSPDYIADLGFTRQVDVHRWSVTARHDAEPRSTGALRSWSTEGVVLAQTDWSGHPTYAYLYPQLHLQFSRQTHLSLFAYADFLQIREHEFGPRRAAGRPGAFFGEPSRRTIYHGASLSAETAPSERIAIALSLDRSWNGLDFDFGGGPRYPRVSPAALADPNAPLDPGTGDGQFISFTVDWRPTDALRLGVDLSRSTLVRDDTGLTAYDQRLATVRTTYQFHRAVFARLRASYDSLAGNLAHRGASGVDAEPRDFGVSRLRGTRVTRSAPLPAGRSDSGLEIRAAHGVSEGLVSVWVDVRVAPRGPRAQTVIGLCRHRASLEVPAAAAACWAARRRLRMVTRHPERKNFFAKR